MKYCCTVRSLYGNQISFRPDFVALKVAEKIAENNNDACLIMVSSIPVTQLVCLKVFYGLMPHSLMSELPLRAE